MSVSKQQTKSLQCEPYGNLSKTNKQNFPLLNHLTICMVKGKDWYFQSGLIICVNSPKECPLYVCQYYWFLEDILLLKKNWHNWDTWVAQWVKHLTSAQVLISQFVSSSPASDAVLTTQSLEPVLDSVSPSLSAPPRLALCLSLPQNK